MKTTNENIRTIIGNWKNGNVTVVYPHYSDMRGFYLSDLQAKHAYARMSLILADYQVPRFRYVSVQGAHENVVADIIINYID